jgi:hypothetical protein
MNGRRRLIEALTGPMLILAFLTAALATVLIGLERHLGSTEETLRPSLNVIVFMQMATTDEATKNWVEQALQQDPEIHSYNLITKAQYNTIIQALDDRRAPPQNTKLGGDIYIHGNGAGSDWTWGCVALENDDVRELFNAVAVGTPVTIKP